jgi:integrase-like protein
MRLLYPSAQLVIKILLGPNVDEVASPARSVVGRLDDSRMAKPAPQRKAGPEPGLAGIQARKPHPSDADQPRLLGNDLYVAKRLENADVVARQVKDTRPGTSEQVLDREVAARVPQILADQPCAALWAGPDRCGVGVKPQLRRLFRAYGLPEAIRSDNGAPFASSGIHGLNHLNVWRLQLGITHQRITPGSPQENGAHERLHKTLKERVARPPAANLNLQQRVFNCFRKTYNELRPHEALNDETPASRWTPSPRCYPEHIARPEYPGHFEVRKVSSAGTFRLHSGQHFLSQALNQEYVGFEEIEDSLWNIVYYDTLLGRFDERTQTITGAPSLRKKC